MNNPLDSNAFVLIWIGFPLLAGSVAALFFFWGMRNGQFADQERARYLPLESGCLEAEDRPQSSQSGRHETGGPEKTICEIANGAPTKRRDTTGGRPPC